ncbi:MAG: hypothetical protein ACOCRX_00415 [Candidatus Woesearchaeota archaeon]
MTRLQKNQKIKILGEFKKIVEVTSYRDDDFFGNSEIYDLKDGSQLMYDLDDEYWSFMIQEGDKFSTIRLSFKSGKFTNEQI